MLKSIYIKGFKSFCSPLILDINAPVIVFIGPNGCGKSNIFDAFLWILAEQSIKKLRGDNAQDLIFNGTKDKEPSNFSEVTLEAVPESINGKPAIPLLITRRIFRNDTSQFYLNNKSTRLFQIRDKLGEYNLNISPFSFISQGNVENLLNKKPSELRELFEEVAGIYKYKKIIQNHKQSITQKQFEFNLLNEKKEQILSRLNNLKDQSDKAKLYQSMSLERQTIFLESLVLRFKLCFDKINRHKTAKVQLDMEYKEENSKYDLLANKELEINRDLDNVIQRIRIIDRELNNRLKKDMELKSSTQVLKEKIDLNEKERGRLENELSLFQKQIEELKYNQNKDMNKIDTLNSKVSLLIQESQSITEKYNSLNSIFAEIDSAIQDRNKQIQTLELKLSDLEKSVNINEKDLLSYEINLNNNKSQIKKLEKNLSNRQNERECLQDEIGKIRSTIMEKEKAFSMLTENISHKHKLFQKKAIRQNELRESIISARSSLETLEMMAEKSHKQTAEKLKGLCKEHEGFLGLFYEIFDFPGESVRFIDSYLGNLAGSIVFENDSTMKSFISKYTSESGISQAPALAVTSLDRLSVRGETSIIYRDREYYLPFCIKHKYKYKYKENDKGEKDIFPLENNHLISDTLLIKHPFLVCWPLSYEDAGIIYINQQINDHRENIKSAEKLIKNVRKDYARLENEIKSDEKDAGELKIELDGLNNQINNKELSVKNYSRDIRTDEDEIMDIEGQNRCLEESVTNIESILKKEKEEIRILSERLNTIKSEYNARLIELDTASIDIKNHREKIQAIEYNIKNTGNEIEYISRSISAARESITGNILKAESIDSRISQIEELLLSLKEQLVFFQNEHNLIHKKISEIAEEKRSQIKVRTGIQKELDKLKSLKTAQKERLEETRDKLHKLEINYEKDKAILDIAKNEFLEHNNNEEDLYSYDLKIKINDAAYEGYKNRIKNIDNRLNELGEINPLAIKEYEKEKNKFEEYLIEIQDVETAIRELDILIDRANKEALEKYCSTVYSIEENFTKIFQKLFSGGSAHISLIDSDASVSDNELAVPIPDIKISPPGKNVSKINLLSGGEKALSALALIFSLFLYKPSPFCFLDEVDASLDEINTERFIELVKEFSENTQFFIITHNRKTMAIGDYIYGITSEDKGVSKVLSIAFEE